MRRISVDWFHNRFRGFRLMPSSTELGTALSLAEGPEVPSRP
jgi:hypothetical protein